MTRDPLANMTLKKGDASSLYVALADHFEALIESGELKAGRRLPTQRDVAQRLKVNLTTVARAFKVLSARGLIVSKAGSGSVVAAREPQSNEVAYSSSPVVGLLDLTVNRPTTHAFLEAVAESTSIMAADAHFSLLEDYHPPEGAPWVRTTLARWLKEQKILPDALADRLIVTSGAQHALDCILRSLCAPGDGIAADAITYQGIVGLCEVQHLRLSGVAMDAGGMLPDALEAHCRKERPKAIIMVPTLHNPTAITLSSTRRQALAEVARRHDVPIIEDDVYRPLYDGNEPTLWSLAPERNYYIGGFSKCVAPGLRTGFIVAPPGKVPRVAASLRIGIWCNSPLNMWLTAHLIETGQVNDIVEQQKQELRARQKILIHALDGLNVSTHPTSTHAWLTLTRDWEAARLVMALRRRGVAVLGSDLFVHDAKAQTPQAIRLNVGAPRSREDLARALEIIVDTLQLGGSHTAGVF